MACGSSAGGAVLPARYLTRGPTVQPHRYAPHILFHAIYKGPQLSSRQSKQANYVRASENQMDSGQWNNNKLDVLKKPHYNHIVSLTSHPENIMVDIAGPWTEKGMTANLDLVVVLDTSGSMEGQKLQDVKQAAKFIIQKIGKQDTLTFVPFSSDAGAPSSTPPASMSDRAKRHAERFIDALTAASGGTNIEAGLHAAVSILNGRRDSSGRAACIFLMSDGEENKGHARYVVVSELRVYTFGFGHKHDRHLLHDIARKSHGGTYHYTPHSTTTGQNKLKRCSFAKILGKVRDVSALDVQVTLKPHAGATIQEEKPGGDYWVTSGHQGAITIDYGFLARHEKRRILVNLHVPAVDRHTPKQTVMTVECTYRVSKVRESKETRTIDMTRDQNPPPPKFIFLQLINVEVGRRSQADRIRKMKSLADAKKLDMAMDELAVAKKHLAKIDDDYCTAAEEEEDEDDDSVHLLDALAMELEHIEELLESRKVYSDHGSAYLLAAILSHDRQSFAARGRDDDVDIYGDLPRMRKYMRQAGEFERSFLDYTNWVVLILAIYFTLRCVREERE